MVDVGRLAEARNEAGSDSNGAADAAHPPNQQAPSRRFVRQAPVIFRDQTPTVSYTFPVVNDTGRSIQLRIVQNSCTCSDISLGKAALDPGERTDLDIVVDTRRHSGPQRFTCTLGEESGARWHYEVATTVYKRCEFDPPTGVALGAVDPGTEKQAKFEFRLYAADESEFPKQISFEVNAEPVKLQVSNPQTDQDENGIFVRHYPIRLALHAPQAPGIGQATILTRYRDRAATEVEQSVYVTWNVRSLFVIDPPQVFFGRVRSDPDEPIEKVVRLRRTDGKPFRLYGLKSSSRAVQPSADSGTPAGAAEVHLKYSPALDTLPLWGKLEVETDHPLQPEVRVMFAAVPAEGRERDGGPARKE